MPTESPPALASYREVRFDGKRHFELFADSIRIRGTVTLRSDIDTTIPLAEVQPRIARLRIRNSVFWGGLWLAVGGFTVSTILIAGFRFDPFTITPGLPGIMGMAGLALCVATFRKVEFAQFESRAGVPILDVAKAGPDRKSYDEFVSKIQERVEACQQKA